MGFFKFFKKKQQVEKKEIVSQNQIYEWILNKKRLHQEKEQEFLAPIKERILQLISELKLEISTLENIDVDNKKVDLKIKLIVKKNLINYIGYLKKIIERLNEINQRDKIVEKINFVFEDFKKRSRLSYEKVTLIIGKEMQATKDSIKNFLKDLRIIFKNKEKDFKEFEIIEVLEKDVNQFKNFEQDKLECLKNLNNKIKELDILEENLKDKEKEIEQLRKSNKFKEQKNKKEKLELKKQEFEKNINFLKTMINFKELSNFYHTFNNEMKLIKEYKENFKQTLQKLGTNNLINFLKESKLDNPKILELIEEINNQEKQILKIVIEDIGINKIKNEIKKINLKIQVIKSEKSTKEKRLNNLNSLLNNTLKEIKEKLEKINVVFD